MTRFQQLLRCFLRIWHGLVLVYPSVRDWYVLIPYHYQQGLTLPALTDSYCCRHAESGAMYINTGTAVVLESAVRSILLNLYGIYSHTANYVWGKQINRQV